MVKQIVENIKEINEILGDFLKDAVKDHHKQRDGDWYINIDKWNDRYNIEYHGYILGDITTDSCNLSIALESFKNKLQRKITVNSSTKK